MLNGPVVNFLFIKGVAYLMCSKVPNFQAEP